MFKVSDTIAGLATLALACVPAFAMSTNAFAAPAKVQVADLDLSTTHGAREFDRRTEVAANRFCNDIRSLSANAACRDGVRAEVAEKLVAMKPATTHYAAR